jgi:nitrogen fixation NifU-like protein
MYPKKVLQHFMHPKNLGKIKDADGIGEVTNPHCGDTTRIYIKVQKKRVKGEEKEIIKDIKFETLGCAAAISTSSVATVLVKGKTLEQAKKITPKDVMKELNNGLPKAKVHCSLLALDALKKAIENYESKK